MRVRRMMLDNMIGLAALVVMVGYLPTAFCTIEGAEAGKEVPLGILTFFVLMLVIGTAVAVSVRYIRAPYTAILIIVGAVIGYLAEYKLSHSNLLGTGILAWMNISPEVFLSVFLPVLLFAAAFILEWHFVRKLFFEAFLLAGPGVLIGMGLTAVLVKYTLPYGWSWIQCLLLGGVLSATDPVAVAAIMSEAALPMKLQTLVNLEALLNDGAAFVVYTMLKNWADGKHQDTGQAFKLLFRLAAGGPAIGLGFGMVTSLILILMYKRHVVEMLLTIAAAYGSYITADEVAGSSGVLSVVALGIWFCYKGLHHISRSVEKALHELWEALEFVANTLVFIVSGAIIAGRIYDSTTQDKGFVEGRDWGYAALLWIYLTAIRVITFIIFLPVLNWRGYRLNWRECTVLAWSGLRGAVGLALGLQIYGDDLIHDDNFRSKQFFLIGVVAVLTIVIQGTTMRPLLHILGMTTPTREKSRWMHNIITHIEEQGEEDAKFAKHDPTLGEAEWHDVERFIRLHEIPDTSLLGVCCGACLPCVRDTPAAMRVLGDLSEISGSELRSSRDDRLQQKRGRFLKTVRQAYINLFQAHFIASNHIFDLRISVDAALDQIASPLCDWKLLGLSHHVNVLAASSGWVIAHSSSWHHLLSDWGGRPLLRALENKATTALAFCNAHQQANHCFHRLETKSWYQTADTELQDMHPAAHTLSATEQVLKESRRQIWEAFQIVLDIKDGWPEALRGIKTSQLAREVLNDKESYVEEMKDAGLLETEEAEQLQDLVHHNISKLMFRARHYCTPAPKSILRTNDAFKSFDHSFFQDQVWPFTSIACLGADSVVGSEGRFQGCTPVLLRGKVRLVKAISKSMRQRGSAAVNYFSRRRYLLGGGHVGSDGAILAWNLLQDDPCPFTALAVTPCLVAYVQNNVLSGLMARDFRVRAAVWRSMGVGVAIWQGSQCLAPTYEAHVQLFRHALPRTLQPGEVFGEELVTFILLSGGFIPVLTDGESSDTRALLVTRPGIYTTSGQADSLYQAVYVLKVLILPSSASTSRHSPDTPMERHAGSSLEPSADRERAPVQAVLDPRLEREMISSSQAFLDLNTKPEVYMSHTELLEKRHRGLAHGALIKSLAELGAPDAE